MIDWIDSPDVLRARLDTWSVPPTVALDTEFVRERTYYPQLALVQLAIPGEVLLVDPLVAGMPDALRPLLQDARTCKLMHSASEDLQALQRGCAALPTPLFDTQVAAAMAGLGTGLGYQKLVQAVTGTVLEKGETRSDWLRRPLSEAQRHYAAEDVLHLHALHAHLAAKLETAGRSGWLRADCERAVRNAGDDADDAWPHLAVRSAQALDADGQARLCRLLRWRDAEARRSDRPKGWVLDSELAVSLCRRPPGDFQCFSDILDRYPRAPRKARQALWSLFERPLDEEERTIPHHRGDAVDKQQLKRMQDAVATVAQAHGLPEGLLCPRKQLESLLQGAGWPVALAGWREPLLRPVLVPLLPASAAAP